MKAKQNSLGYYHMCKPNAGDYASMFFLSESIGCTPITGYDVGTSQQIFILTVTYDFLD